MADCNVEFAEHAWINIAQSDNSCAYILCKIISRTAGYLKHHLGCHVGAAMTFLLSAGANVAQTQAFPQQQGCLDANETASTLEC